MRRAQVLVTIALALLSAASFSAQDAAPVDFARDVQPLLQQHCVGCHGPTQQMNGFRLDRRSDAMRGGTIAVIGPGNSEGSRLYMRLIGGDYGQQMPPTGALRPNQIAVIKAWIDQGAAWPDAFANEASPVARRAIDKELMKAALWGQTGTVRRLLDSGADPNARNDAGATPLIWAAESLETTRLLLDYGADPSAKSVDGRSAVIVAAGRHGAAPIVRLLLDYGADPSAKAPGLGDVTMPLTEAAYHGDADTMRLLIRYGADVKAAAPSAAVLSIYSHCDECFQLMAASLDGKDLGGAAISLAPPDDDAVKIGVLLDRGADLQAKDLLGRTLLMRAASADTVPINIVKRLIASGADVNASTARGESVLGYAERQGNTAVVDALRAAGARNTEPAIAPPPPAPAASARAAITRSLPLLQSNDVTFLKKAGCVSCHNNSITAIATSAARTHGLPVDETIAAQQVKAIAAYAGAWRERALQDIGIPGESDTISYLLAGLNAAGYRPDETTEAMARFLRRQQTPGGQWRIVAHRPPIESSDFEVTAVSMRALQVYAPTAQRAGYDAAVRRAARWLAAARPHTTEDRAFRLMGLGWAKASPATIQQAGRAILAEQRPDGGWAPLPSLTSDAYATGQTLVALAQSGAIATTSAAYQRGVEFLLRTQLEDGSWFVRTRAVPLQPHFESGFPHGRNQFISAAATNWATMALAMASGKPQ